MKKLLYLLLLILFPIVGIGQAVIDLDLPSKLPGLTLTGPLLLPNGTVSLPSLAFESDLDLGIFRTGADAISISVNSVEAARFVESTTTQLLVGDGTASLPSFSFIDDPNTGFYKEDDDYISLVAGGIRVGVIRASGINGGAFQTGCGLLGTSVAGATTPAITFGGDTDIGLGRAGADLLSLIAGGKEGIRIDGVLGGVEVIIKDTLVIEALASPSTPVLITRSTGVVDTLATADIGEIAIDHSGGMSYVSTPGTQTIGTGGTFERLNEGAIAYTASHLHSFTHSDGRLTYTGTNTKHFDIAVYVNIESDEAAALVEIILAKGGATISGTEMRHDYRATDTDAVLSFGWLLELATNEYIEIFGTSDTNGDTFFVHNLQMIINEH